MSKIVVNAKEYTVESVYPYRYDYGKGKEVLRISILESNHAFEEVKLLANTANHTISYYEEESLKNEYTGYCKDFSCNYTEGVYSIEITRMSESDIKIAELENKISELESIVIAL